MPQSAAASPRDRPSMTCAKASIGRAAVMRARRQPPPLPRSIILARDRNLAGIVPSIHRIRGKTKNHTAKRQGQKLGRLV